MHSAGTLILLYFIEILPRTVSLDPSFYLNFKTHVGNTELTVIGLHFEAVKIKIDPPHLNNLAKA